MNKTSQKHTTAGRELPPFLPTGVKRMNNGTSGKNARREAIQGYLYILPWVAGFLLFLAIPMVASLLLSFTNWDTIETPEWIGLANYKELFADELFFKSMKVTLYYTALSVPLGIVVGLSLSLLLNAKVKGINLFRTLFYLPSIISGVAVAMLFRWILNDEYGLLNYLLSIVGISGPDWFADPRWIVPGYVVMSLWGVGGGAIIYLGGLQNIPVQLYEAAKIDGAGVWQRFWKITLPLITPTIFFLILTGIIGAFQIFTQAYVASGTNGGPESAGLFFMLYLYEQAFQLHHMGYASAMAWVGSLITMSLALIVYQTQYKWVYYGAEIEKKRRKGRRT